MCIYQYVRVIRCMTEYLHLIIRMDMLLKELRTVLASNCDLVVATVPVFLLPCHSMINNL